VYSYNREWTGLPPYFALPIFPPPDKRHRFFRPRVAVPNLFLSTSEAKFLHIANLILTIERCDTTRRGHGWHCWYSRAVLLVHFPVALFSAFSLYRLFYPA
jgi:hypothetical protein